MSVEFTRKGYKHLLRTALNSGYDFVSFESRNDAREKKTCLLRHDVDCDLGAACELSGIENQLGIRSTFFIMMRSPMYNPFGRANNTLINKMIENGSQISLHYDEGYYPRKDASLQELIEKEIEVFRIMFGIDIKCISFHQPSERVIKNEIKIRDIINTYDKDDMKGFYYLSDSNMNFKESPHDLFLNPNVRKIQLLIHPIWWANREGGKSTSDLWEKAILDNLKRTQDQICETERAFGKRRDILIERK